MFSPLSDDLIDSLSQILEQKASLQVKGEVGANSNFNDKGEIIKQKTLDPKSILIIGSNTWYDFVDGKNKIQADGDMMRKESPRLAEVINSKQGGILGAYWETIKKTLFP